MIAVTVLLFTKFNYYCLYFFAQKNQKTFSSYFQVEYYLNDNNLYDNDNFQHDQDDHKDKNYIL